MSQIGFTKNPISISKRWRYVAFHIKITIILVAILLPYISAYWNPYDVLGVRRDANLDQIKRAYRDLARKLHPDKSNSHGDETGRRFIELNKAFNILKDPARRSRFDQHGETEENRHSRGYHQYQNRQAREYRTHDGPFRTFTYFSTASEGLFRQKSITAKQYSSQYIKESEQRPFVIFFYSDFCPSCSVVESIWTKITDELAKFNVGSFTINVYQEPRLAHELGVNSIPYMACLINGQVSAYYSPEVSLQGFIKFIRNLLPNNLVASLSTHVDQDRFISSSPQLNRLSAIIIDSEKNLKLRYKLVAFEFKRYYRFGHISTKTSDYALFAKHYNLTIDSLPQMLVFGDDLSNPVSILKIDSNDASSMRKHLSRWPFLNLPKLLSQDRFDDLCLYAIPKEGSKTSTRLCVILLVSDTPSSMPARNKMVEFMELNNLKNDEMVVFTFLDHSKQNDFVQTLVKETEQAQPKLVRETVESAVIVIERHPSNPRKAHYKWLNHRWNPSVPDDLDRAKIELFQTILDYVSTSTFESNKVVLPLLNDEEAPSLVSRVFWRSYDNVRWIFYNLTSRESFSALVVLVCCACIMSLFLYNSPLGLQSPLDNATNFVPPDFQDSCPTTKRSNPQENNNDTQNWPPGRIATSDCLRLIELKAETYNGLIRLLKPGYRSIILLVDDESREILLDKFKKAVWPYRRNKTLLFGYLSLERNFDWYKSLLEEILGVETLNVNRKNCVGTVLSLNGFKKYVRVYHAKHHESNYEDDEEDRESNNDGSFLGFDSNEEIDELHRDIERGSRLSGLKQHQQQKVPVENLLDRLPIWLDKVFDGLTKRYFIDSWPENMN